jgi:hypothetical protein
MREREGLIARVRQMRRAAPPGTPLPPTGASDQQTIAIRSLEVRVAHVEGLVEGLQDSVHRESQRVGKRMAELEARLEPSALAVSLSKDARERGLS